MTKQKEEEKKSEEEEKSESEEKEPLEPDYEAITKAEEERIKDQKVIADAEYKLREVKHDKERIEEDEEEKPLTRKEMQELLLKERQSAQKEFQEQEALRIARANTSSESEAKAAVTYWKTRVNPTGNLQEDIFFAIGGLNYNKIVKEKAELARSLRGKDSSIRTVVGTERDMPEGVSTTLDSMTKASYTRAGFVENKKTGLWEKKLPSGKTAIKDPTTKQIRIS